MCKACFNQTKTRNRPTLEMSRKRGTSNTCRGEWVEITVGYYHPDNKYYEIRLKKPISVNRLCHFSRTDICDRGERCRYAHNRLELEVWIAEDKMSVEMRNPKSTKIHCVICKVDFKEVHFLERHLQSREHVSRTDSMKILPEVGSSLEYNGPIRARPKIPYPKDTYELCRNFNRFGRCDFFTGCKHAHSEEELKVWLEAQEAEEEARKRKKEQSSSRYKSQSSSSRPIGGAAYSSGHWNRTQSTPSSYSSSSSQSTSSSNASSSRSQSFSSQSQDGACKNPSSSNWNKDSRSRSEMSSSEPEPIESDLGYYWRVRGEIEFIRIEDVVKNRPNHIEILCNNDLQQTLDESPKEFKWMFRIKSSKREILHGIILYNDRNMFKLEGVHKGVEGGKYSEIKFPYIPNRNCYQLQREIDSTMFIDVNLLFKSKIGQYQVYIVVECKDGGLVARKVNIKVKEITFKQASEIFKSETVPIFKKVSSVQDILPVNWEQNYQLFNSKDSLNRHKMPDNLEERVKSGFFSQINDRITQYSYVIRFRLYYI